MNPLEHVLKAIQARRHDEVEKNATGASDWDDYNRRKGKIQGLEAAIDELDATKRKLQQDGDLDSED